jgi:hypothetical protein
MIQAAANLHFPATEGVSMARRSADSGSVSVYQGRYHRTLGKVLNERGEVGPKKFLLGTDRRQAEEANCRLERLWGEVVAEHGATVRWMNDIGGLLGDSDMISGRVDPQSRRRLDLGPIWRAESLIIAEALRRGQHQIVVPPGQDEARPSAYVERLNYLRRTFGVITFIPESWELYSAGQQAISEEARDLVEQAEEISAQVQIPLPVSTGQTLYQALDAYGAYAVQKNSKETGQREAASARRLKDSHRDLPLDLFGISAMETLAAYWAARPPAKRTGRPIALDTITNQLKTARRFIHWLHRTDAFKWMKPIDAEEALRVQVKRLRTDSEIAALSKGVAVWSVDELTTLYRYATDLERFLILLGLNCAFAQAEFCTLRRDEIIRDDSSVTIKRIRRKSHIYGEFRLWPQSIVALEWFTTCGGAAAHSDAREYVMVTEEGRLYDRTRLANIWNRLLDRVQKDHPDFRRLSFKRLRKTGGQLVRQRSDGEIAGVFICHGRPVLSDDLSDAYTNRPFGKVAAALALVQLDLKPLFDAVPDAFTQKLPTSPNISRATIERIQKLHAEGIGQAEIVRITGFAVRTVRRWTVPDGQSKTSPQ